MLSWPPGPRDTDGVWAPHWYEAVWRVDRVRPLPSAGQRPCPPQLAALAEQCQPFYERLHAPGSPDRPGGPHARPGAPQCCRPSTSATATSSSASAACWRTATRRRSARSTPSVQGGDAVWEGLRLYQGRIFRLDEHLARLRRSAAALAFTAGALRRGDHRGDPAHAAANEMTDGVHIRLTLTRGVKITSGMDPG